VSLEAYRAAAAATHFLPALLWAVIAWDVLRLVRRQGALADYPWVLLALTTCVAVHYATWTVTALLAPSLQGASVLRGVLAALIDGSIILLLAFARHIARLWPMRRPLPSRRWLAVNYGICALVLWLVVSADLHWSEGNALPPEGWFASYTVFNCYLLALGAAMIGDLRRVAGRGWWRPGLMWDARSADVVALGFAFALVLAAQVLSFVVQARPLELLVRPEPCSEGLVLYGLNGLAGLIYATPLVVRNLGDILPAYLVGLTSILLVGGVQAGVARLTATTADASLRMVTQLAAVLGIVFVVVPGGTWLRAVIERALFRRGRLRWAEMQQFVQGLAPERGTHACCEETLHEVVRAMGLRGAAALLTDGAVVRVGEIRMDALADVWPRDGRGLPPSHLRQFDFKELPLPLMAALADADVLAAIRIVSPRRHWGYAFITTDLRGASLRDDDDEAVGAVAHQLALVLDAADLLARTVAVERSLAHAERLAAIGELAARVAHEIRNPVTAARSLAQQLARDPTSPLNTEHADLIVEELERVERQVRDLLRYARREDLRTEPTDLGGLVAAVASDLAPKAEQAGVTVELDTTPGIVAPADRERLRQVMINLIENAIDALAGRERPRRLALAVGRENGSARLRVADNGPGIPAAALARLFEPFFSLKPNGTGLGLAIAKRTIDAHGGTITAESREGEGTRFEVLLPLEGQPA